MVLPVGNLQIGEVFRNAPSSTKIVGNLPWAGPGSPPDRIEGIMAPGCSVRLDAWMTFLGQRDALEKQQAEDDALRDRLMACANGNVRMGRGHYAVIGHFQGTNSDRCSFFTEGANGLRPFRPG
jgi:hypothetical protein